MRDIAKLYGRHRMLNASATDDNLRAAAIAASI